MLNALTWDLVEFHTRCWCWWRTSRGQLKKEARMSKYRDCFEELSIATGVVMRGGRLIIPKDLIPY